MPFEYPTPSGVVRLIGAGGEWTFQYADRKRGCWSSPDIAALAVAHHQTGLPQWDSRQEVVSQDILDWRPLGESI